MAMNPIPWQEIRREYLDGATYQELGEKYGIAPSTIGRRRHKEHWGCRGGGDELQRRCLAMVRRLAAAVEETMDSQTEPWAVKELKDLSALTKDVVGLQKLVMDLEPAEEEDEAPETVRVVLEGPLEDWGG